MCYATRLHSAKGGAVIIIMFILITPTVTIMRPEPLGPVHRRPRGHDTGCSDLYGAIHDFTM